MKMSHILFFVIVLQGVIVIGSDNNSEFNVRFDANTREITTGASKAKLQLTLEERQVVSDLAALITIANDFSFSQDTVNECVTNFQAKLEYFQKNEQRPFSESITPNPGLQKLCKTLESK